MEAATTPTALSVDAQPAASYNDTTPLVARTKSRAIVDIDPELEGQVCGPADPPPHETTKTVGAILKSFVGSGILFLPAGFSQGGYAFSIPVLLVMAVLNLFGMIRLLQCREKVVGSFGFVAGRAFGRTAQIVVDGSLVFAQTGFCCVYVSFIAQNALQVINSAGCWLGGEWLWLLILLQWPILVPMTWVRRLASLGPALLIADALILIGLFGVIVFVSQGLVDYSKSHTAPLRLEAFNREEFSLFLGTAIFAFEGIGMITPIYNSLSPKGQSSFPWTLTYTLGGVTVAYIVFGLVPYCYFAGVLGYEKMASITLLLPRVWWATVIQAGYCVALAASFPFMLSPAIAICEKALVPTCLAPVVNETRGVWLRNAFRAFFVAVTLVFSLVGVEQLGNFVSLIGALCCAPLSFIYPCAFHLALFPDKSRLSKIADIIMIVFGCLIFVFSSWRAIEDWAWVTPSTCI